MAEFHCLAGLELERFLLRRRAIAQLPQETSLAENLVEILRKANEFVPSAAGSILLDDPLQKEPHQRSKELTFIAAFGDKAEQLVGAKISAENGIAGHVYSTGKAYYSGDVAEDRFFSAEVDRLIQYRTESLVAIPVRIEKDVCGVLELINRQRAAEYSAQDRDLLQIFAGYMSVSIQNVLDARNANEIAKRDNLTGLFNDRFLHHGLAAAISRSVAKRQDLVVIFLDLDYFKRVNDSHGHLAGSQVLQEIGGLLNELLPPDDAFAARYGGDEFVIVLPGADLSQGVGLAEHIRRSVVATTFCREPGEILSTALRLGGLTCSVGVASLRRHVPADVPEEQIKEVLLRLADTAMYVAKETGRNRTATAGEPVPPHHPDDGRSTN